MCLSYHEIPSWDVWPQFAIGKFDIFTSVAIVSQTVEYNAWLVFWTIRVGGFFHLIIICIATISDNITVRDGGGGGLFFSQCLEPCETLDNFLTGKLNTPAFSVWVSCFILSLAQTLLGQFSVGNKKRLKSDQARHEVWSFYTTHNDVLSSFYSLQQFACRAQNTTL